MKDLVGKVAFGLALNIAASYYILPKIYGVSNKYYNSNDIYMSILVGLVMTIIELLIIFAYNMFFGSKSLF